MAWTLIYTKREIKEWGVINSEKAEKLINQNPCWDQRIVLERVSWKYRALERVIRWWDT